MAATLRATLYTGDAVLTVFLYEIPTSSTLVQVGEVAGYATDRIGGLVFTSILTRTGDHYVVYRDGDGNERASGYARLVADAVCDVVGTPDDLGGGSASGVGNRNIPISVTLNGNGAPNVRASLVGVDAQNITDDYGSTFLKCQGGDPAVEYFIRIATPPGYQAIADRSITVGTTDPPLQEFELIRAAAVIPPAGATEFSFRVSSQGGASVTGVIGSAKITSPFYAVKGDSLGINVVETAEQVNGVITLILLRDQDYELTVTRTNGTSIKLPIRTLDAESCTLSQVVEV